MSSQLRRTVRTLSSILRVAESLDRSHTQTISSLDLRDRGEDYLLQVRTPADAELEIWATNRHLQPFERLLGKPVRLEAAAQPPVERVAAPKPGRRAAVKRRARTTTPAPASRRVSA